MTDRKLNMLIAFCGGVTLAALIWGVILDKF